MDNLVEITNLTSDEQNRIDKIIKNGYEIYIFKYMTNSTDDSSIVYDLHQDFNIDLELEDIQVFRIHIFDKLDPSQKRNYRKKSKNLSITKEKTLSNMRNLNAYDYIENLQSFLEEELLELKSNKTVLNSDGEETANTKRVEEMIKVIKQLTDMKLKAQKVADSQSYMPVIIDIFHDIAELIRRVIKNNITDGNLRTNILEQFKKGLQDLESKYKKEYSDDLDEE